MLTPTRGGDAKSSAGMARLSAAARRVGDVVDLISRIAAQTNLLALNATDRGGPRRGRPDAASSWWHRR